MCGCHSSYAVYTAPDAAKLYVSFWHVMHMLMLSAAQHELQHAVRGVDAMA
jgi:hypothetical protein